MEPTLSSELLDKTKLTEFPLTPFAAIHWFHHYAKSSEGIGEIEQLMVEMFKDKTKSFAT